MSFGLQGFTPKLLPALPNKVPSQWHHLLIRKEVDKKLYTNLTASSFKTLRLSYNNFQEHLNPDGAWPGSSRQSICLQLPVSLRLQNEHVAQWHMSDTHTFISQGCADRLIYFLSDAQKTPHTTIATRDGLHLLRGLWLATCPNSQISACLYEQTNVKV